MDFDSRINDISSLIREALAAAYDQGQRDAAGRIMEAARNTAGRLPSSEEQAPPPTLKRARAPHGSVKTLVDRELTAKPGLTPSELAERARDEQERKIATASIRAHLRKWMEVGRYKEIGGRWYLARDAERAGPSDLLSREGAEM